MIQYIHLFFEYRKIRQKTHVSTEITLYLQQQRIRISCDGNRKHHDFHQNATLPAFWLPPNDSTEFVRQRDDLQKQIVMRVGVHFE
ncbi:hypothetical protein [Wielerella bovis]|uniref:hypothetical protein n=1 Tax=Wielerella bovis TaxID=2917790 RepID=UPI0020198822|nr:hypothetical protein [Wielerella bovis]ULJ64643.1 hypothetical protein MIS33_11030 [Wielerella bovis]ULJ66915.1 hypothetical protein MIS31_11920 [Wielerella bovis]